MEMKYSPSFLILIDLFDNKKTKAKKMSKNKCYHCKHGGNTFKVNDLTHLHCFHPKQKEEYRNNPKYSPWDTLRVWWDTCEDFESKNTPEDENK